MAGARVFDSPYQWNLYGASGRTWLGGDFGKTWKDSDGGTLILSKIYLTGLWTDRTSKEFDFTDLRKDFSIELPQASASLLSPALAAIGRLRSCRRR
jgi:hypothetical protein